MVLGVSRSSGSSLTARQRLKPHLCRPALQARPELSDVVRRRAREPLDFFADPFPPADVVTMGLILDDWNPDTKMHLIRAAYDALPEGKAFIVVENLIDDARGRTCSG